MSTQATYRELLLVAYEQEVAGVGYFSGLAERFRDLGRQAELELLAAIEEQTARAIEPLLEKYRLVSRSRAELERLGREDAATEAASSWDALMTVFAAEFPVFVEGFERLVELAPEDEKAVARQLLDHERTLVDFAQRELQGESDDAVGVVRRHLRRYAR
jgi:dimethylamine/trimethylamine dehydrogenase